MTRPLIGRQVTSPVPCSEEVVALGLTPEESYNLFYELTCKSYIVYGVRGGKINSKETRRGRYSGRIPLTELDLVV